MAGALTESAKLHVAGVGLMLMLDVMIDATKRYRNDK
jgi:hypothetical protein